MPMIDVMCEWCDLTTQKRWKPSESPPRFCDRTCSARWRMSRPDYVASMHAKRAANPGQRERDAERMRSLRQRPDVTAKLEAHLRGEGNPFRDPRVQARAQASARATGFGHLDGGNGRGLTEPQALLSALLGWPTEVVVRTGRSSPWPKFYSLDVASPELLVGIECDGHSHLTQQVRDRDARKDAFLSELGWAVLRFTNRQVLEQTDRVLAVVGSTTSRPGPGTM